MMEEYLVKKARLCLVDRSNTAELNILKTEFKAKNAFKLDIDTHFPGSENTLPESPAKTSWLFLIYSTVFYSTIFYSTVFYSTVFYSTVFYTTVFYTTVFYSTVFFSAVFYSTVFFSAVFYSTVFCSKSVKFP